MFRRYDFSTLAITLTKYKINFTTDDRIVRNRIRRFNNYKQIEELRDYLENRQEKQKILKNGKAQIKKSRDSNETKLQKLITLIASCDIVCPDKSLKTEYEVNMKISELEKIDEYLSNEILTD